MASPVFKKNSPSFKPTLTYKTELDPTTPAIDERLEALKPPAGVIKNLEFPTADSINNLVNVVEKAEKISKKLDLQLQSYAIPAEEKSIQEALKNLGVKNPKKITFADYKRIAKIKKDDERYPEADRVTVYFESAADDLIGSLKFEAMFLIEKSKEGAEELAKLFGDTKLFDWDLDVRNSYIGAIAEKENSMANEWFNLNSKINSLRNILNSLPADDIARETLEKDLQEKEHEKELLEKEMTTAGELSYIAHKKALQADNILTQTYHLTQYTMFNHLGGTLDCVIDAVLDSVFVMGEINIPSFEKHLKSLKLARSLIGLQFKEVIINKDVMVNKIKSLMPPWALAPQRELLRLMVDVTKKVTYPIYKTIEEISGVSQTSQGRLVQCVPLAEVSNVLMEQLIKAEQEVLDKLGQILQFNDAEYKSETDLLFVFQEKERYRALHRVLGDLIEFLERIQGANFDPRSFSKDKIKQYLVERGYYTYYDPEQDEIMRLDLDK